MPARWPRVSSSKPTILQFPICDRKSGAKEMVETSLDPAGRGAFRHGQLTGRLHAHPGRTSALQRGAQLGQLELQAPSLEFRRPAEQRHPRTGFQKRPLRIPTVFAFRYAHRRQPAIQFVTN